MYKLLQKILLLSVFSFILYAPSQKEKMAQRMSRLVKLSQSLDSGEARNPLTRSLFRLELDISIFMQDVDFYRKGAGGNCYEVPCMSCLESLEESAQDIQSRINALCDRKEDSQRYQKEILHQRFLGTLVWVCLIGSGFAAKKIMSRL